MEAVDANPSYRVISLGKDNVQGDSNPSYEAVLIKCTHSVPKLSYVNQSPPSDPPQQNIEHYETVH